MMPEAQSLKVTILGSGSAYGVPRVGNDWGDCDPANPKNKRHEACILLEQNGTKVLVDIGPGFREQSLIHKIQKLDAIVHTHAHADHILGHYYIPTMMRFMDGHDLPIYADEETWKDIFQRFSYIYETKDAKFGGKATARPYHVPIKAGEEFKVGAMTILPYQQQHGKIQSLGFRVGNFAYSTDLHFLPEESYARLDGLDCWILECNDKVLDTSYQEKHMFLDRALKMIERVKPKQAYLTHLGTKMDYNDISAMLPDHVALAYDGLVIEL